MCTFLKVYRRLWQLAKRQLRERQYSPTCAWVVTAAAHFGRDKIINEAIEKRLLRRGAGDTVGLYCRHGLSTVRPCAATVPPPVQGDTGAHFASQSHYFASALRGAYRHTRCRREQT